MRKGKKKKTNVRKNEQRIKELKEREDRGMEKKKEK